MLNNLQDGNRRRNSIGFGLFGRFVLGTKHQQQTSTQDNDAVGGSPRWDSPVLSNQQNSKGRPPTDSDLEVNPASSGSNTYAGENSGGQVYPDQLSDVAPDMECLVALERLGHLTGLLSKDVLRLRNEVDTLRSEKCEIAKELQLEKKSRARGASSERKGYNQEHLLEAIRQQKVCKSSTLFLQLWLIHIFVDGIG